MRKLTFLSILFLTANFIFAQNPVANFEVIVHYECNIATTEFVNLSQNAEYYNWEYNSTTYSSFEPNGQNYSTESIFDVKLIAFGTETNDTLIKTVHINPTRLEFDFEFIDNNIYAPCSLEFSNQSFIRDEDTVSFEWKFTDHPYDYDFWQDSSTNEENPLRIIDKPGTYFVDMRGTINGNCTIGSNYEIILVKDSAQVDEFEFITSDCFDDQWKSPCNENNPFEFRNDSLIFSGHLYANCLSTKTATIRYNADTVEIRMWEFGDWAACDCNYCFEIGIPNIGNKPTYVRFLDELHFAQPSGIFENANIKSNLGIYPNPIKDIINIIIPNNIALKKYEIIDITGALKQVGTLNGATEVHLDMNTLYKGIYLLNASDSKGIVYRTKFIVE